MTRLTRRALLASGGALALASGARAQGEPSIHVRLDANCECCTAWTAHLREAGFAVTEEEVYAGLLVAWKTEQGIPLRLQSCHTGETGGYLVEGHVPATDIRRLLAERPDALGLAVPGMPYGSPGMGPEEDREAYDVLLFREDGSTEVWASYLAT